MSIPGPAILEFPIVEARQTVTARDAILYALSVGYGAEPLDAAHLCYLNETSLVTAPTFANVVAHAGPWMKQIGTDWNRVLHAEHRLILHRPIPVDTPLVSRSQSLSVVDRGAGKGMFATFERVVSVEATGERLASVIQTNACLGDGGCGSAGRPPEPLPGVPDRSPDASLRLILREDTALLYRLNGDLNPLHIDPAAAERGGFRRPILHGLCAFGHAGYALSRMAAGSGLAGIETIAARFTAPIFPGETLEVRMWRDGADVRFRGVAAERDVTVLDYGVARLA